MNETPTGQPPLATADGTRPGSPLGDPAFLGETTRLVAETGGAAGGVAGASPGNPDHPQLAMAPDQPWDEAGTRAGVGLFVSTVDDVAVGFIEGKALDVVGAGNARRFADRVAMTPAVKTGLTEGVVGLARKYSLNIGPEATLAMALTAWMSVLLSARRELVALANHRPPPPEGIKEVVP